MILQLTPEVYKLKCVSEVDIYFNNYRFFKNPTNYPNSTLINGEKDREIEKEAERDKEKERQMQRDKRRETERCRETERERDFHFENLNFFTFHLH